jgi:hypothetical protein
MLDSNLSSSSHWKRFEAVKQMIDREMGDVPLPKCANIIVLLYVSLKGSKGNIVGCCVAHHITQAFPIESADENGQVNTGHKSNHCLDYFFLSCLFFIND